MRSATGSTRAQPCTYDAADDTSSLTSNDPVGSGFYVNIHLSCEAQAWPITVTTLMSKSIQLTVTMGYNAAGQRSRYTVTLTGTVILDEHFQHRDSELGQMAAYTATLFTAGGRQSRAVEPCALVNDFEADPALRSPWL